jgi:hypothetical protein
MFGFGKKRQANFETRLQAYIAIGGIKMADLLALQREVDESKDPDKARQMEIFQDAIDNDIVTVDMCINRRG